jgi:uncharacterized membrane protein
VDGRIGSHIYQAPARPVPSPSRMHTPIHIVQTLARSAPHTVAVAGGTGLAAGSKRLTALRFNLVSGRVVASGPALLSDVTCRCWESAEALTNYWRPGRAPIAWMIIQD